MFFKRTQPSKSNDNKLDHFSNPFGIFERRIELSVKCFKVGMLANSRGNFLMKEFLMVKLLSAVRLNMPFGTDFKS